MKICFVASEVAPLSKTGGLGDIAGALPRQLSAFGHDVRIFTPLYRNIDRTKTPMRVVPEAADVKVQLGTVEYEFSLHAAALPGSDVPIYLIECAEAYDRPSIYTTGSDEHLRFLLLQRATLESCQRLKFAPDILHCNDWHTALLPLYLKTLYAWDRLFARTRSLLSIHNIGYQGEFAMATLAHANLVEQAARLDSYDRSHGRINWLKEGIRHADCVATVSPTYATEICGPIGGHGLDGALRDRHDAIVGILNGVDYDDWSPNSDALLPHRYDAYDLSGKVQMKEALVKRGQLNLSSNQPLFGMVTRLTPQKGIDLLIDALPELLRQREFGLIALGSGELRYENFFADLHRRYPDRVFFQQGYSEELAHWIEAGSDIFLMPSMYEPCGLNQMYSLKYGTVPVVRNTGGLADSVQMWNASAQEGTGIVFNDFDLIGIRWALHTVLDLFKDRTAWLKLMQNGMHKNFSWEQQAKEYVKLYEKMLAKPKT